MCGMRWGGKTGWVDTEAVWLAEKSTFMSEISHLKKLVRVWKKNLSPILSWGGRSYFYPFITMLSCREREDKYAHTGKWHS